MIMINVVLIGIDHSKMFKNAGHFLEIEFVAKRRKDLHVISDWLSPAPLPGRSELKSQHSDFETTDVFCFDWLTQSCQSCFYLSIYLFLFFYLCCYNKFKCHYKNVWLPLKLFMFLIVHSLNFGQH